jgi:hypothetical protein
VTAFFIYSLNRRAELSANFNSPSCVMNLPHGGGGDGGSIARRNVILDTEYLFDKNYIRLYYFYT